MVSPRQTLTVTVPRNLSEGERIRIGNAIIKHIKQRTDRGIDKDNRPFKPYSDSYKKSNEFRIAGKTSLVNLRLTSRMLDGLEVIRQGVGFITIGFSSQSNNDKAFFAKDPRNGSRRFLGISKTDLDRLVLENSNSPSGGDLDAEITKDLVRNIIG